jgi:hypothetical protein
MLRKYFSVLKNHKHFKLGLILTAVLFCVVGGVALGSASKSEDNKTIATKNASENAKSHEDGNVEGSSTEASDSEQPNSSSSTDKKSSSDKKSSDPAKKEQPTGQSSGSQPQGTKSTKLLFNKSSITFGPGERFAHAEVYSESSEGFGFVNVSSSGDMLVTVKPPDRVPGNFHNRQYIQFVRPSMNLVGEANVQFTAKDQKGNVYTGKLFVKWPPVPYFTVEAGDVSRSVGPDETTFAFNFRVIPTANFGTPVLRFTLEGAHCKPGSNASMVTTYAGSNNYSLSCTLYNYDSKVNGGWSVGLRATGDLVLGGGTLSYTVPNY